MLAVALVACRAKLAPGSQVGRRAGGRGERGLGRGGLVGAYLPPMRSARRGAQGVDPSSAGRGECGRWVPSLATHRPACRSPDRSADRPTDQSPHRPTNRSSDRGIPPEELGSSSIERSAGKALSPARRRPASFNWADSSDEEEEDEDGDLASGGSDDRSAHEPADDLEAAEGVDEEKEEEDDDEKEGQQELRLLVGAGIPEGQSGESEKTFPKPEGGPHKFFPNRSHTQGSGLDEHRSRHGAGREVNAQRQREKRTGEIMSARSTSLLCQTHMRHAYMCDTPVRTNMSKEAAAATQNVANCCVAIGISSASKAMDGATSSPGFRS